MSEEKLVEKTTFQVMEELQEKGDFTTLIKKGVIAIDWLDHLNIYRTYLKYRKEGNSKMESYHTAAVIHSVHFKTVIYIKNKMEF